MTNKIYQQCDDICNGYDLLFPIHVIDKCLLEIKYKIRFYKQMAAQLEQILEKRKNEAGKCL